MRILFLHPEDSPRRGPWAREQWDLIVDLGQSSEFSEREWSQQCRCRVLRTGVFRRGMEDAKQVRQILAVGRRRLVDEQGIDWWDLSLRLVPDLLTVLPLARIPDELGSANAELWATRGDWIIDALSSLCHRSIRTFRNNTWARSTERVKHYAAILRQFSSSQLQQILLDKYDSRYRWRSRFASRLHSSREPVVLLPSAYVNVSRMAAGYAQRLMEQPFLLIATRQSAKQFIPPRNVEVRDLAGYAGSPPPKRDLAALLDRWSQLRAELCSCQEMRLLDQAGRLDVFPGWIQEGLFAREAWRAVLDHEPVCGVLCGDDSNMITRTPVILAANRGIPTGDFHHGAFDGRYLLKDLISATYLAKNEMERDYLVRVCELSAERCMIAAPSPLRRDESPRSGRTKNSTIVFFSEPYELASLRAEEVYRELLPLLGQLAVELGKSLTIKLHPFESRSERTRMVHSILGPQDSRNVRVLEGPLTAELLGEAWFGITVESTTVLDCAQSGVCCFLCAWLSHSPYQYIQQYARFGVGPVLQDRTQMALIPERLAQFEPAPPLLAQSADPALLRQVLTSTFSEQHSGRLA